MCGSRLIGETRALLGAAEERGAGGGVDLVGRELADAVAFIGVAWGAGAGELAGGEARAGERRLEDGVAFAERAPDGGVLGTEQGDDGCANGGGDVHGAAVVAEEDVELGEEGGELADRERPVERDEMGFGVSPDFLDEGLFGGAGDEEDLRAEFVLQAVGDGGEAFGGPEAKSAATAGVEENAAGSGVSGLGSGAEEGGDGGEIGGEGDEADFAGGDGNSEGAEEFEIGVGDMMGIVERVGDFRGVGVEARVAIFDQFTVEAHPEERAGEAGEERGFFGVVEIEDVREPGAAEGGEEGWPRGGGAREGEGGRDVGVEGEDGSIGGFGENGELSLGPVEAEIPEDTAEEDDVAEVAAADNEDARGVGGRKIFNHGWHGLSRMDEVGLLALAATRRN